MKKITGKVILFIPLFLLHLALAESISVCHGYGCKSSFEFNFNNEAQQKIARRLSQSTNATSERKNISWAIQQMYLLAAKTYPPLAQDKAGNWHDGSTPGKMDCVDHSNNDSTFLQVMQNHHWLRFHQAKETTWRAPLIIDLHYTAVLHEINNGEDWAVDSWFKDFGNEPIIVPLKIWKKGYHP